MIYILQFSCPLGNTNHQAEFYIGMCRDDRLQKRLAEHRAGRGANITRAASERGISFDVVCTLPGDRETEKRLKARKNTRLVVQRAQRGTLRL